MQESTKRKAGHVAALVGTVAVGALLGVAGLILAYLAGMAAVEFLIHRPDRRLRAAVHAAEVASLREKAHDAAVEFYKAAVEVERVEQVADALMSDVAWSRGELAKRDLELDAANVRRLTLLRGVR